MNRLSKDERAKIIAALCEGNSLRAAARMCDVAFNTVLKLLPEIGAVCEAYQRRALVNLRCKRIQCDEIWSFCYAKAKNVPISTSYVERQNLTMRMNMRRFTRLTNAFSKKAENHAAAVALHYTYYNFCRIHQTLRVTPAMEAGITDHIWSVEEIADLLDSK